MTRLLQPARIVIGLCIAFFGLQYLSFRRFAEGLPPAPPWTPGAPALAVVLGVILLAAGIALIYPRTAELGSRVVAGLFLAFVLFLHFPHFSGILQSGVDRTRAFEPLAIAGAAFVLVERLRPSFPTASSPSSLPAWIEPFGRALFAFSMLIFGEQHFQYAAYVAPLIPAWIPAHLALTYFTGLCFLAAALAIAFDRLRPLAASLLGVMFLSWFLIVHLPRVAQQPHNGGEWSSAVVALLFSAASFLIATPPGASHSYA